MCYNVKVNKRGGSPNKKRKKIKEDKILMEEKVMNKRFNIYCAHDEADAFNGTDLDKYDVLMRFLEDVVKKENKKAYEMEYEIYSRRKNLDGFYNVYHFNRTKKLYKYWSDEEITSAIETLVKYGFLVKVDNNTMTYHINGNAFKEKKESA